MPEVLTEGIGVVGTAEVQKVNQSIGEKLTKRGLDVEFLAWLEGKEQRLPDPHRVRKVKDKDFVAALRAVDWLSGHFSEPELISPAIPEQWLARFDLLEQFLSAAVRWSVTYYLTSTAADLEALERVLEELLPRSSWQQYRKDIEHLRKRGLPLTLEKSKPKASGGTGQSEQTMRMRAAVRYVSWVSGTPFVDLAEFWNEQQSETVYQPDQIQGRLRKGHDSTRGAGTTERLLAFWRRIYGGDLRDVFPGPCPVSRALEKHLR